MGDAASSPPEHELSRALRATAASTQDRLAAGLGISRARRVETVVAMLENNARRAPGYWIQLTLSMGIATLGLVLGSTAVVIGAMLVSPLMGPIVELGMGFAVGSPLLVMRAALRVLLSIVIVVSGAALLTLTLPFHEVTGEVAARTAPTALDLFVAIFCALTAAYTTVRPSSDTTAAAAGTAIGIALVPPLCVAGFGLGTGALGVASGAALLFTANFSAILLFAVLSFIVLGFNQVDAANFEHDYLGTEVTRTERLAARMLASLRLAFGSRYGMWVRVLIPVLFLAAVYIPLSRALDEVKWEVSARSAIRGIVTTAAPHAVQTSVTVERHAIALRLLVVGAPAEAARLEERLTSRVVEATGVTPVVSVTAGPDARALLVARAEAARPEAADIPRATATEMGEITARVGSALAAVWPTTVLGPLVGWRLVLQPSGAAEVRVYHFGAAYGAPAEALLARDLAGRLGRSVVVVEVPLPDTPMTIVAGNEGAWLFTARRTLDAVAEVDGLVACVEGPLAGSSRSSADRLIVSALGGTALAATNRLVMHEARRWSLRVARNSCATADSSPRDSSRAPEAPR